MLDKYRSSDAAASVDNGKANTSPSRMLIRPQTLLGDILLSPCHPTGNLASAVQLGSSLCQAAFSVKE
jgi:hypothetical protein